jgi:hypothetical protein
MRIVASPETAAELALQAIETAETATIAMILTACPSATQVSGAGSLFLAVALLAAGQPEQATAAAETAALSCTDLQRRAHRIRLTKLLNTGTNLPPGFSTALKQMIELFAPTQTPAG